MRALMLGFWVSVHLFGLHLSRKYCPTCLCTSPKMKEAFRSCPVFLCNPLCCLSAFRKLMFWLIFMQQHRQFERVHKPLSTSADVALTFTAIYSWIPSWGRHARSGPLRLYLLVWSWPRLHHPCNALSLSLSLPHLSPIDNKSTETMTAHYS